MSQGPGPGARIGDFEIVSVAGEGGMGVVYRAVQVSLDREVALKLVAPAVADSDDFRARFDHESRLAASIDHPHVISIYAAGEHDGQPYLAMQWVDGPSLDRTLKRGPLGPERTAAVVSQMGGALDVAHATGLVHRDVKPGNILLRSFGGGDHAYLVDFGIARNTAVGMAGITNTGSLIGTLGYMAPEQLRGERADARSDLYALGCVLFESLTGARPFEGPNEAAVLWAHGHDDRPRPSEHAPELEPFDELIERALAIDSAERFQSGAELALALDAATAGAPLPPPEPRPAGAIDHDAQTELVGAGATAATARAAEPPSAVTRLIDAPRTAEEREPSTDPYDTDPRGRPLAPLTGALAAAGSALLATALVLVAAFGIATASRVDGLLDLSDAIDPSALGETLTQACALMLAPFELSDGPSIRIAPATYVLVPLLASVLAALGFARLTRGASRPLRLAWGAATGIGLALAMLVVALIAGSTEAGIDGPSVEPQAGAVSLLALLWGGLGGLAGAAIAARRDPPAPGRRAAVARAALATLWASWKALAIAIAIAAILGTGVVIAQIARDVGDVRTDSGISTTELGAESAAFALDHGVHLVELGAGGAFRNPGAYGVLGLPFPLTRFEQFTAPTTEETDAYSVAAEPLIGAGSFRIFELGQALADWAFAILLGLISLPIVFAGYGGVLVARARAATSAAAGAAWGLLVGPTWALGLLLLDLIVAKQLFGMPVTGSAALNALVGATLLGAIGGALRGARQGRRRRRSEASSEYTARS